MTMSPDEWDFIVCAVDVAFGEWSGRLTERDQAIYAKFRKFVKEQKVKDDDDYPCA